MNYNSFFGFSDSPFLDVPDPRFLYLSQDHERLLTELVEFSRARRGIAVVSGEEGVGKTMLVQALTQRLPQPLQPLVLARPEAEPLAIALMIGQALGIDLRQRNVVNLNPLTAAIQTSAQQGVFFVLVLDDAHLLTDPHLEEIYILSQMTYQDQQLLPIILVGRKGLPQKLASAAHRRLQGLVQKNLLLAGLPFEETTRYIDHRLQQVGSSYQACFAEGCTGQLFSRTGGIPRRINQVCDQALNRAWQANQPRVTRDLLGEKEPDSPFKPLAAPPRGGFVKTFGLLLAGALLVGLLGYVFYLRYLGPATQTPPLVAPTQSPPPSAPVAQSPPSAPPAPASPTPGRPPLQADEVPSSPQVPPPPDSAPAPESAPSPEVARPEAAPPPPPAPPEAAEPETLKPLTHVVTPEDGGLLKIVAARYPDEKEVGYDAVILANPQIEDENFIYKGQILILPTIDKNTKIVTLPNKQHFALYQKYFRSPQKDKDLSKLEDLDLRVTVRETTLYGNHQVYRIFLGGYDTKEELQKAIALARKK